MKYTVLRIIALSAFIATGNLLGQNNWRAAAVAAMIAVMSQLEMIWQRVYDGPRQS